MMSFARRHYLPPVYPSSPSPATHRGDGINGVQEPDIKTYVKFIDDKLKKRESATGRNKAPMFFIPKIPEILRRGENDNDGPKIISIGPYHRGKPRLQSMEDAKFQRLAEMLEDVKKAGLSLDDFVKVLAPLEAEVRRCYSDTCEVKTIKSEDFVEMMLLDSYFILHLLSRVREDATKMGGMSWIGPLLFNDLLLLENQLPFYLIQRVFQIKNKCEESSSLVKIALDFYHLVSKTSEHPNEESLYTSSADDVHHLLHLYHMVQILPLIGVPTQKPPKSKWIKFCAIFHDHEGQNYDEESGITIPSATALQDAGIKFKKKKGNCILDVSFSDGVLEIPHLLIQHGAFCVFQSLIALELWYSFYSYNLPQLTVYFYFMDHIINTVNDVSLLQKSGIIEYAHGSEEEVAKLFNQLTRGATINPNNYLSGMYKDVNRYCKKKRNIWRAVLLRRHFSNPWTILSLIGALILLVLTFIQSYFSVFAYFQPPSTTP